MTRDEEQLSGGCVSYEDRRYWNGQRFDEQPDCGGNRHYDYISVEEHKAAEKTLENKKEWRDLTTHEVVVLRDKAVQLNIVADIVDHLDRLALIRCLFSHVENRDYWMEKCRGLEKELAQGEV